MMQSDRFIDMCATDEPITDCLVIDGHCHVDFWIGMYAYRRRIDDIIELCDALGIDRICVNYAACPEMRRGNDIVAECMRRYPDRVEGFCYVNYYEGGHDAQQAELRRCFDELGFRGIKVINVNDTYPPGRRYFELDDPLQPTWEFASRRHAPILCHGVVTAEIARSYPDARFIVAHGAGDPARVIAMADLPNVYCDVSATTMPAGALELLYEKIGPERILYGSDLPASDPGQRLGVVMSAGIPERSKELILGDNMQRLLDEVQ
ncbi:MAG: amidohydrolase family protein [Armatimonadota bacterium]|nr:amidohydrolase family protein [Armatimonadota bacterium]